MLKFKLDKGLYIDDESVVREEVRTAWKNAFIDGGLPELDTAPETPAGQLIDSQTAAIADKDAQLLYLANMFNPTTADGRWQDALAKIYLLDRHVAQSTIVTCVCQGLLNTVIPKGALVKTADNITLVAINDAKIGTGGTVSALFAAQQTGPVEVAANTVTSIITVVSGWDTVNNPTAGITGRLMETKAELERRRLASVAGNSQGSVAALYGSIANIDGILACVVLENDTNETAIKYNVELQPHSILASVYGGEDSKIAEAIYRKKNAGCATSGNTIVKYTDEELGGATYSFKIMRPAPVAVGVRVTFSLTASTPSNIDDAVRKAILANFNGEVPGKPRVSMASTIYASRFISSAESAGIQELVSIEVSMPHGIGWSASAVAGADEVPSLSENNIIILPLGSA